MNKERIKRQIENAISQSPTSVSLKRTNKEDDGFDGHEETEVEVKTFDAFFDSSDSRIQITQSGVQDFGKIAWAKKLLLLAICDTSFEIKIGDYFIVDNIQYEIEFSRNVQNIYWECDVKAVKPVE